MSDKEVQEINEALEGTVHVEYSSKKTHMWNGETCVKFFDWVSREIRRKRKSLGTQMLKMLPSWLFATGLPVTSPRCFRR